MTANYVVEEFGKCLRKSGTFSYSDSATSYKRSFSRSPQQHGDFSSAYPHFRKPTGYSGVEDLTVAPTGSFRSVRTSNGYITTHDGVLCKMSQPSVPAVSYSTYVRDHSILKAYSDLQKRKISFGVAAAEARKTFGMVENRTSRVFRALLQARRGHFLAAAKTLDLPNLNKFSRSTSMKMADFWLEYSFGWKPLLSDIKGAIDEYDRITQSPLPFVTGIGNMKESQESFYDYTSSTSYPTSSRMPHFRTEIQNKVWFAKTRIDYVVGNKALADSSRLGILNPLEVAWELFPWSFVIDWFIPVEGYIRAFTADAGLVYLGGTTTEFCSADVLAKYIPQPISGYDIEGSGEAYRRRKQFKRLVHNLPPGLPIMPPMGLPKSMYQVLHSLSLLRTRFK